MMQILFEDNHLLVVNKPINVPVQEDSSKDEDLLTILKNYLKEKYDKPGNVYLGLVHRLDRPVGGVMVFAKTSKAASRLSNQVRENTMDKIYEAVIEGFIEPQTLTDYLTKNHQTNTSFVTTADKGKYSELILLESTYQVPFSFLKVQLITGRSHQIRVQLSSRDLPIWGDQRYNPRAKPGQQIALFASELSFNHPITNERLTFKAQPKTYPFDQHKTRI